jgi:hypothetical protein
MIWPFKRDPLERDAALLVRAANTLAFGMFGKISDEFPFIPHDERGQRYWDFVVTIAGVFFALIRLRTLNLNEKRRLKLEKKVAACLVQSYPQNARLAFEHCHSFFDKAYYAVLDADHDPKLVASDAIGMWVVWEILRNPAETEQELKLVRWVGLMIVNSFFEWWEKDNDLKTVVESVVSAGTQGGRQNISGHRD